MQYKKTAPEKTDFAADLPELTEQQKHFVTGILGGKNSSEAYRAAYNCENMAISTIWAEASRLRCNHKIAAWIGAARRSYLGNARITLEQHINRLEELRQIAIDTGNVGAAVQAEQLIGKALGHYKETVELHSNDPLAALKEIASIAPDIALQLAHSAGINWHKPDDQKPASIN